MPINYSPKRRRADPSPLKLRIGFRVRSLEEAPRGVLRFEMSRDYFLYTPVRVIETRRVFGRDEALVRTLSPQGLLLPGHAWVRLDRVMEVPAQDPDDNLEAGAWTLEYKTPGSPAAPGAGTEPQLEPQPEPQAEPPLRRSASPWPVDESLDPALDAIRFAQETGRGEAQDGGGDSPRESPSGNGEALLDPERLGVDGDSPE